MTIYVLTSRTGVVPSSPTLTTPTLSWTENTNLAWYFESFGWSLGRPSKYYPCSIISYILASLLSGYDSDDLLEDDILEQDDNSRGRSHTPVIKEDEYYENLGDVLTKKYSLPVNEIQIKIDRPDDEPDFVLKGRWNVLKLFFLRKKKCMAKLLAYEYGWWLQTANSPSFPIFVLCSPDSR